MKTDKAKTDSRYLKQAGSSILTPDEPCTKWSMLDLKFQIENNLRKLLCLDHHFKENHFYTDLHLLFGYIAGIASIGSAS